MALRNQWFSLAIIQVLFFGCGRGDLHSNFRDEVDPIFEHETHYFGHVFVGGHDVRKFPTTKKFNYIVKTETASEKTEAKFSSDQLSANEQYIDYDVKVLKGKSVVISCDFLKGTNPDDQQHLMSLTPTASDFKLTVPPSKRIDVNHILVKRQDGTTYWLEGKYTIDALDKAGNLVGTILTNAKTRTGVDVLPGYKYRVKVEGQTEELVRKEQEFILDFLGSPRL